MKTQDKDREKEMQNVRVNVWMNDYELDSITLES